MKIIVTGAAGFIGCNLVQALNQRGHSQVIAVDDLSDGDKFLNLRGLQLFDYLDKSEFYQRFARGEFADTKVVFHQGACSDTTLRDGRYMMQENYGNSHSLLQSCQAQQIRLIYASSAAVYGASTQFTENPQWEQPLNVYGYSKLLFDQVVRQYLQRQPVCQIAGLRYFNVYGPHEQHKGRMASVAFHHFQQFQNAGQVKLFGPYQHYAAGQQERDFVYVQDVITQNLFLLDNPHISGIFNAGTGRAEAFNEIAHAVINTVRAHHAQTTLSLSEQVEQNLIEYIPFPDDLIGRYQCHTRADMQAIIEQGYHHQAHTVAQGVAKYVKFLLAQRQG